MTAQNEELRDKLEILKEQHGDLIDYMPHLETDGFEQAVKDVVNLSKIKDMILTHVYSLRKEIKKLKRKVAQYEEHGNRLKDKSCNSLLDEEDDDDDAEEEDEYDEPKSPEVRCLSSLMKNRANNV